MQQARTFPDSVAPAIGRTDRMRGHVQKHIVPYILILPSIVFLIAIEIYPLAVGIYEAFLYPTEFSPGPPSSSDFRTL
jgi:ABC-type sugar transport system permease subunit